MPARLHRDLLGHPERCPAGDRRVPEIVNHHVIDLCPILRQLEGAPDAGKRFPCPREYPVGEVRDFSLLSS